MAVHLLAVSTLRENMSSWKCCRMPTLVILGVILTIVLVCITGITLTNSINISNIVKLREKVASDSAAANGAAAAQTRAAIVEQQYSQLQQHHLSRSDLNYLAAHHPKNLQRFGGTAAANGKGVSDQLSKQQNKIIIEVGVRNFSSETRAFNGDGLRLGDEVIEPSVVSFDTNVVQMRASSSSSSSSWPTAQPLVAAIVDGNIDSISVPALSSEEARRLSESLLWSRLTAKMKRTLNASEALAVAATDAGDEEELQTIIESVDDVSEEDPRLSIVDHNPAMIDFEKRAIIKKVKPSYKYLLRPLKGKDIIR